MSCLPIPKIPFPTLGGGLSIPPIPVSPGFDVRLCCKIAAFSPVVIPPLITLPFAAASVLDAMFAALDAFNAAVAQIATCPLE